MSFNKNSSNEDSFTKNRPTSPHLQIYKWNLSSLTSICHRFTGVALYLSIVAISWYIVYYTYQLNFPQDLEVCDCPLDAILKDMLSLSAIFIAFALYYHLLNGIRHLFWDIGFGFERDTVTKTAVAVICGAIALTTITIFLIGYFNFS